jgi:molybdenum cofactor cytidylyltransferase
MRNDLGPAGIVLAAGQSSRMPGISKLLRPFAGSTVIESAVDSAIAGGLDPVVVVTGHQGDRVASRLVGRRVTVVANPDYLSGRVSSLQAGLRRLAEPYPPAVLVLLGDEPAVSPATIRVLIRAWKCGAACLIRAHYLDRPGHPVVVDRRLFSAALALAPGEDVWANLPVLDEERAEIRIPSRAPLDVDRPQDLAAARRRRRQ